MDHSEHSEADAYIGTLNKNIAKIARNLHNLKVVRIITKPPQNTHR